MVIGTEDNLKSFSWNFEGVKKEADTFVQWANNNLLEQDDYEFEVHTALPEKKTKNKESHAR